MKSERFDNRSDVIESSGFGEAEHGDLVDRGFRAEERGGGRVLLKSGEKKIEILFSVE